MIDVTSQSKNFSMSLMLQVSMAFVYILNILEVPNEIVLFWSTLYDLVQEIFDPRLTVQKIQSIRIRFTDLLDSVIFLFPF